MLKCQVCGSEQKMKKEGLRFIKFSMMQKD